MIPANELAAMQESLNLLLPDTCNILGAMRDSDGAGGETETWEVATASVACRLDFLRGGETMQSGALQPYTQAILTLPQATVITEQNRVEHGGNTYTVQAVNLGSGLFVKRATLQISKS